MQITAKKGDKSATIEYDFGANLQEMTEKFGEDVVYTNARKSMVITAQAGMRRYLESGLDEATIQEKLSAWKPGVQIARTTDPVAALMKSWEKMDDKQKAEILAKLKNLK